MRVGEGDALGYCRVCTQNRAQHPFAVMTIAQPSSSFTPSVVAGLVKLTLPLLAELGVATPTFKELAERIGVSRNTGYTMAEEIRASIQHLPRPKGRPSKEKPNVSSDISVVLLKTTLRYLQDHPGAMIPKARRHHYSDGFRRFIVDLYEEHRKQVSLTAFAESVELPFDTVRSWLRNRPDKTDAAPQQHDPAAVQRGTIAMVVACARTWHGRPKDLRDMLAREHHIDLSMHQLYEILRVTDRRRLQGRKPRPDPEAIRGALERFFPGAQLMADGTGINIQIGDQTFCFCWELAVDAATGAHVGFSIRNAEDGQGLLQAVDHAAITMGQDPMAILTDNKPCNHSEEVTEALDERQILNMAATPGRPQNKSSVEGAFGLFKQKMAPIVLPDHSPREQARAMLNSILFAYCAGRNHVPLTRLNGRSAAQVFDASSPTQQERDAARERLREIERGIRTRNDRDRRRTDPAALQLVEQAFDQLGLQDPNGFHVRSIARYGLAAVIEAIAIFSAKHQAGVTPTEYPERYLLGIAHNVSLRNEHMATYDALVELRIKARDIVLQPLIEEEQRLQETLTAADYLDHVATLSLSEIATLDRRFWQLKTLATLSKLPDEERQWHARRIQRRLAATYAIPKEQRAHFAQELAAVAVPLI